MNRAKAKITELMYSNFDFKSLNIKGNDIRILKGCSWIYIEYEYKGKGKILPLTYSNNFICDGASVPRIGYFVLERWHDEKSFLKDIPAVVHDGLFVFGGPNCEKCPMDFEEANAVFVALLKYCKSTSERKIRIVDCCVSSPIGRGCFETTNSYDKHNYNLVDWDWGKKPYAAI